MSDREKMQALGKFFLRLTRPLDSNDIVAGDAQEMSRIFSHGKRLRVNIRAGVAMLQELPCFEDLLLAALPRAETHGDLEFSYLDGRWQLVVFSPPRGALYHLALREAVAQFIVNYNKLALARLHLIVEGLRSPKRNLGGEECK